MRTNLKRILAAILTMGMLFVNIPVSVFAAEYEEEGTVVITIYDEDGNPIQITEEGYSNIIEDEDGNVIHTGELDDGADFDFDMENEEKVFIKEYFPFNIAHRNEITNMIAPLSEYEVQYKMMMSDYSDLFLSLMKITFQEYLIPVVNVLYENNTCYVVFKYMKTISYGDFLPSK